MEKTLPSWRRNFSAGLPGFTGARNIWTSSRSGELYLDAYWRSFPLQVSSSMGRLELSSTFCLTRSDNLDVDGPPYGCQNPAQADL